MSKPADMAVTGANAAGAVVNYNLPIAVDLCAFDGFLPPLADALTTVISATATQTLPAKWRVGGDYGAILAPNTPYLTAMDCKTWLPLADQSAIAPPADMSSLLQYDTATSPFYQLNYQLKGKVSSGKCYTLTFTFNICPTAKRVIRLQIK
ncbi:hypothetical protein HXX76_014492 [Chlamydomonas incerta]|uniref:Uncharacterized protein n=1 Tax=Chlamydomonas incerta TaxID=51695 RepID=A0A835VT17_CHLIN|nr:hypothetical protein HXX76_014492 [Chlamydomonas incerta]|eukprot:KAG2424439.1 hypothetical protein HXX76_014492 [Chlamydomonas incerta]